MTWPFVAAAGLPLWDRIIHYHPFGLGSLAFPLLLLPFILVSRWAARNATSVYATLQGLELPGRRKTVAWHAVVEAHPVSFPSLIPVYRVTFNDGTAPLTFYSWERVEQVMVRFKSPTKID
jgi:hypothetical protein